MSAEEVEISMSVDGFITGSNTQQYPGLGQDGEVLHAWFRRDPDGPRLLDDALLATPGAVITSRTIYDLMDGWGEDGFYKMPVFVLTHRPHDQVVKGYAVFTFVTEGVERAISVARTEAGDKKVHIMGCAIVIQQALNSGLVDSVHLHLAPIILGAGTRLFDNLPHPIELERTETLESTSATHLRYRITHHGGPERPSARPTSNQGVRSHNMLTIRDVATRLPAQDLDRTQHFYSQTLGLEPAEARPGGLRYQWRPRLARALRVNGKGLGNADAVIPGLIPRDPAQPVP